MRFAARDDVTVGEDETVGREDEIRAACRRASTLTTDGPTTVDGRPITASTE